MTSSASLPDSLQASGSGLDDLIEEITARVHAGQLVDIEVYVQQHPEHADRLRHLLPALQVLADLGRSASEVLAAGRDISGGDLGLGTLGDFRIVREVGRGGMGVVYEAEQISLGRRVALKVLPFAGALDAKQLQRFKNEAHAAANLQHQNIVPVYFVGCERGVHFYAMQFVEGQTLAALIQEQRQSLSGPASRAALASGARIDDPGSEIPASTPLATPTGPYTPEDRESATVEDRGPLVETVSALPRSSILDSPSSYFRTVANLGIQAAEALEHAHQLGVIHRDIKPANLMVENSSLITHHFAYGSPTSDSLTAREVVS
jgi:serine/threonine-protein kinase